MSQQECEQFDESDSDSGDVDSDTLHVQGAQVLGDGQTLASGTFGCTAEPSAMRCTDSSRGHFFDMSPASYQVG
ncbi:MAG: hypothetical protein WB785_04920 [Mycobacterium sp.]|uniref:hypothetical protein n=1 Tax=Mycobacterium sp. TaxID=1785 RepID=UPI003C471B9E